MKNFIEPFALHEDEREFRDLKAIIKKKIGFNCDDYKQTHFKRRLAIRLRANQSRSYKEYADALASNETEVQKLKDILTVNVTELFRNQETYEVLRSIIFPELVKVRAESRTIKIWSAGCSNGEEPYSIAIMLREFLGISARRYNISILGTDIDEDSLKKAERGLYQSKQIEKISKDRLGQFFIQKDNNYQITDEIRSLVSFKHHDMISGSRLHGFDMIFCRNVTIYFEQNFRRNSI
jgi:chemotaxis protein methyltransferase CheR